jgi:hypothetical protein
VVGRKPVRSNSLRGYPDCDREVRELADLIWGPCDGDTVRSHTHGAGKIFWNVPLKGILAEMGVPPDFVVESPANDDWEIDYVHRITGKEEIYFVANNHSEPRSAVCRFRVAPGRVPSFWHPDDGSVRPCHVYQVGDGFIRLTVELPPRSSVFVVFREEKNQDHLVAVTENTPQRATAAIQILSLEQDTVTAKVWRNGMWRIESAQGRSGEIAVSEVPADQTLAGPWQVAFPENLGAPSQITMATLADWTTHADPGVRHFSGTATYQTRFALPAGIKAGADPVILDLGEVKEVAEVTVNGRTLGIAWKQPNHIDITSAVQPGENRLEIAVTNLWNNRIVGDLKTPDQAPVTRTNLKGKFNAKSPLLPSGLIGPVTLRFPVTVTTRIQK